MEIGDPREEKVDYFMCKVLDKLRLPHHSQLALFRDGQELEYGFTLSHYKIEPGSMCDLKECKMKIHVKTLTGNVG